jgi:EpsI family protein
MIDKKSLVIAVVLIVAMAIAFGLPKAKYKSTDILKELSIPMTAGRWQGSDIKNDLKLMDEQYNFIQALDLREYTHPGGRKVYLFVLDAGNFHNPKVCMSGAGFVTRELSDITYDLSKPFTATAITITKDKTATFLISYWITINGKRVDWVEQKVTELWFSLIGKRKAGLMVRIDVPTNEQDVPVATEVIKDFVRSLSSAVNEKDHRYIFGF